MSGRVVAPSLPIKRFRTRNTDPCFHEDTLVVINDNHMPVIHNLIITTLHNLGFEAGGVWKEIVEKAASSEEINLCEDGVAVSFASNGGITRGQLLIPVRVVTRFNCIMVPPFTSPHGHHNWFEHIIDQNQFFFPTEMFVFAQNPLCDKYKDKSDLVDILSQI